MKIKFDVNLIKIMALFEKITRAKLVDCFEDESSKQMIFVVKQGQISKAIGKQAANVKKLERVLNRKVKLVEKSDDVGIFIKNLVYPARINSVEALEGDVYLINAADHKSRGFIIGRNAQSLRALEGQVRRYFKVKEIKVK